MNKEIKGFILGVLSAILLSSGICLANSQYKTIDVIENNVLIYANGNLVQSPNFTYKDTTYVPLRAVLDLMDCNISYSPLSKIVYARNNYLKHDFPVIYNNQKYETVSEWAYNSNDELYIKSVYSDLMLLPKISSIVTEFPDDENVVYVQDSNASHSPSIGIPLPDTSAFSSTTYSTFPWHLYSYDGKEYLGKLVTNTYDSDSIWNTYGTYGSKYSSNSIWNTYGIYGSNYSNMSAFNNLATKPPKIVNSNGELIGYLTTNQYTVKGITIEKLYNTLKDNYQ